MVAALLFTLTLLWAVVSRVLRYLTAVRRSAFASVSLAGIRELRAAYPKMFPPQPHTWSDRGGGGALLTEGPVVCYVCSDLVVEGPGLQVRSWQEGAGRKACPPC